MIDFQRHSQGREGFRLSPLVDVFKTSIDCVCCLEDYSTCLSKIDHFLLRAIDIMEWFEAFHNIISNQSIL